MICAIGECYLLIAGSWEISIGATYSMGGVIAGLAMTSWEFPIWGAVIAALACGGVVGVVNGFLVQKLELPAFVATVGTQFMAKGLVQGLSLIHIFPRTDVIMDVIL